MLYVILVGGLKLLKSLLEVHIGYRQVNEHKAWNYLKMMLCGQALGVAVRMLLETPEFCIAAPGIKSPLPPDSRFLLRHTGG